MTYLILPVIAGLAITLQTAFSGKLSKEVGSLETVILVHFFGLLVALAVYLVRGQYSSSFIASVNYLPLVAGTMGVLIIFFISKSFVVNGALMTILISVIVQLLFSKIIDHFGLFGTTQVPINLNQLLAFILIITGVVIFQYNQ